jgi:hypothetical protein
MANFKKRARATRAKPTHTQLAKAVHKKHGHFKVAIHRILVEAGLKGVKVRSVRFAIARAAVSSSPCNPPCPQGKDCVLDSDSGGTRWVCV